MVNRDTAFGLKPLRHLTGGEMRLEEVILAASNSIIGTGDPLVQTSEGLYDRASATDVVAAVAAQPAAANSGATIKTYRDPNIVYAIQADDGTTVAVNQSAINLNAKFVTGNAVNGQSIYELDEGATDTTTAHPLKILGLYKAVDNAFGEFNKLEVIINNHKNKGGVGTLGV